MKTILKCYGDIFGKLTEKTTITWIIEYSFCTNYADNMLWTLSRHYRQSAKNEATYKKFDVTDYFNTSRKWAA